MWRRLPGDWLLSGLVPGDAEAIARHLADGAVARWVLRIPQPYGLDDAQHFLAHITNIDKDAGRTLHFAIREPKGELVGLIGLTGAPPVNTPSSQPVELGYWVAPSYWRRGIGGEAVRRIVNVALVEYEIDRLVAGVIDGNEASTRILLANGFEQIEPHTDLAQASGVPRWGSRYGISYERYAEIQKGKKK